MYLLYKWIIFYIVPGRTKVSDDFLIKLRGTNLIVPGLKT